MEPRAAAPQNHLGSHPLDGLLGSRRLHRAFPDSIDYLTAATGIQKRENAVMVTFLGILSFIVFYLIVRLEEMEQRHTKIIRKLALRDLEKSKGSEEN